MLVKVALTNRKYVAISLFDLLYYTFYLTKDFSYLNPTPTIRILLWLNDPDFRVDLFFLKLRVDLNGPSKLRDLMCFDVLGLRDSHDEWVYSDAATVTADIHK